MTEKGRRISDTELLRILEDSDYEVDDLDADPDFILSESDRHQDELDDPISLQGSDISDFYDIPDNDITDLDNDLPVPDNNTIPNPDNDFPIPDNEIPNPDNNLPVPDDDIPEPDNDFHVPDDIPFLNNSNFRPEQDRGVVEGGCRGSDSERGRRGRGNARGRRGRANAGRLQGRGNGRGVGGRGRGRGTNRITVEHWKGKQLNNTFPQFIPPADTRCNREGWNPLQYFLEYFDDNFFNLMVEQTNIYYHLSTGRELKITVSEMKAFVGISMLMSTLGYPRIRLYWDAIFGVNLISKSLPRDRYFQCRSAVHVVNNNDVTEETKATDKLWKVRPIINRFRETILKIPREDQLSIDEQMIPFTGHVAFRQFVPRKPNPTGLKNYVLSTKQGLILDFEIYQGAITTKLAPEVNGKLKLGTGGRAVLRLAETCPPGTHLYFDRYFTGMALLDALREKGISGTGTTMKQRFPNTNLKSDVELTAEGRGECDYKVRDDENLLLLKWVDNKTITLASTIHGKTPLSLAKRYSRIEKRYVDVEMPNIVKEYNLNMGGVDLHNRMLSHYRSYHRTKKWPVRFLEHFFDMAIVNSWLTYKNDCFTAAVPKKDIMDLHYFKMRLSQLLILENRAPKQASETDSEEEVQPRKRQAGRPGRISLPLPEKRKKGAMHLPEAMDLKDAQRCRNPGCTGKTRVQCTECKIFLCVLKNKNCFLSFHS